MTTQYTWNFIANLDGGHDMTTITFTIKALTQAIARDVGHKAMKQLGFKRSDYQAHID